MILFNKKKLILPAPDVFSNRNREYGGYYLMSTYQRRLKFSFFIVMVFAVCFIIVTYFVEILPSRSRVANDVSLYLDSIQYDTRIIPFLNQLSEVEQKQEAFPEPADEDISTQIPVLKTPKKDALLLPEVEPVVKLSDSMQFKKADEVLKRLNNNRKSLKSFLTDSIILFIERAPLFPGGYAAIQAYFYKYQSYPKNALSKGIQGSTLVSFIVDEDGMAGNAMVVKGIDPELDMEAIRLIKSMPAWQPAYYKGKPIACKLVLPVDFKLK